MSCLHATGEGVGGGAVDKRAGLLVLVVVVDVAGLVAWISN